jgi:hypothetical protein
MIDIFIFSLCCASLSCLFQFCILEGNIFAWYGLLLERVPLMIAKPFGLCVYCFNVWVTILFYILVFGFDVKIFLSIGMSYVFLNAIMQLNFD